MCNKAKLKSPKGSSLDTLGQSTTDQNSEFYFAPSRMVAGEGIKHSNNPMLKRWAKKKLITNAIILALVDVAKERGSRLWQKKYWNAFHCQRKMTSANGRTYTHFCRTRFCEICLGIRKAELINKYYPILCTWEQPYFVTLTLRSVKGHQVKSRFKEINEAFRKIFNKLNRRYKRGRRSKIMGLKSLESNFNPIEETYNPHFHLIVNNRDAALDLEMEWSKRFKGQVNSWGAQKITKVKDLEYHLVETIKYGAKFMTDPTMAKRGKEKVPPMIYAKALDTIFTALPRRGVFERFGFNLPKKAPSVKPQTKIIYHPEDYIFDPKVGDWINEQTGELLTGYKPEGKLTNILENNIDTKKH